MDRGPRPQPDWTVIARLGKPRGLRGEIYGEGPWPAERYAALPGVWLRHPDGSPARGGGSLKPVSVIPYKGRLVFRFEGIDSIEAAEPLRRLDVAIPRESRPDLGEDEVYLADLVGCAVVDCRTGETLGEITGWQDYGGPLLLEVAARGEQEGDALLIPFARSICVDVNPAKRRVVVDLPPGLLDLNRPEPGE